MSQWKSMHHNFFDDLTPLKQRNWKYIFDMQCCGSLRITKILQNQIRKCLMFMAKVILLTTKFKTGFQSFFSDDTSLRYEMRPECLLDPEQDTLRKLVLYNLHKSIGELALDHNKSQSTICYHLKKIGKGTKPDFLSCLNFWDNDFYHSEFSDYYLHLYCYIHNVSADMSSSLLQMFVEIGSLYLIHRGHLFWFY